MRIAIFTEKIKKTGGGSQYASLIFAKALWRKGHRVLLLTVGEPYKPCVKNIGFEIYPIKTIPFVEIASDPLSALKKVESFKPDIILLNELVSSFWIGIWVARELKIKNMVFFHTFYSGNLKTGIKILDRPIGAICNYYTKKMISFAEEIIAPSRFARDFLRRELEIEKEIPVIYYPVIEKVKMSEINKTSRTQREEEDVFRIVTLGRLIKLKNVDVGIKAMKILKKYPITYTLIGAGSQELFLKMLVKKLKLEDRVEFLGAMERGRALKKLQDYHLFINISEKETFGITYIEALASGLPLICFDCKITREVLTGFKNVFFVKRAGPRAVAKTILEVYKMWKRGLLDSGIKNKTKLKTYSYDVFVDKLMEICNAN